VALMALEDSNLHERIAGVACLATPFIVGWDRNIGRDPWAILRVNSVLLLSYVIVAFGWLFLSLIGTWKVPQGGGGSSGAEVTAVLLVLFVGAVAQLLLIGVFLLLRKRAREHASKLCRELAPRPLEKNKLLLIRSLADEASGLLSVFQFLSQATVRLFLFGERMYVTAEELGKQPKKLLRLCVAALAVYLAVGLFPVWGELFGVDFNFKATSPWLQIPMLLVVGISSLIFFSAALALIRASTFDPLLGILLAAYTWLMIPLLSILMLLFGFGWQAAVANVLLDVTAETTPPGSWEIHLMEPPTREEIGGPVPPLMHKVYENPRVQRKLSEWIETRASGAAKIT
jgi:hypothetical protein